MPLNNPSSPVAIITAASKGIGAACARKLAERGYRLVLMSRSEAIHAIAREVNGIAVQGTVSSVSDLTNLVQVALDRFGRVDAVINSSGHPESDALLAITDDRWTEVFEMYFLSIVRMSRLVVPIMTERGGGGFVNISGSDVYEPSSSFAAASVIRASMTAYTKLFAQQHAAQKIRMNCVAPNVVLDFEPGQVRADLKSRLPIQRPASFREVADVVAFLLSAEASYVSGETVRVDAGASKAI
ncbi:MAG: SDR family oxidoreductase [Opitutaceae bacterium]|nr:SDR family oxidoreductase [Opitutaceae bacterium]